MKQRNIRSTPWYQGPRYSAIWTLLIVLSGGVELGMAQNELMRWQSTRDLVQPPLTKERELMGQAQRNTLYVEVHNDPGNVTNKVNLAVVYERLGEHAKALEMYRDIAVDEAFYPAAVSGFAKNLYLSGNHAGAMRLILRAESRHGLAWDALLIKAEVLAADGNISVALRVMENAWLKYLEIEAGQPTIVAQVVKVHLLNNLGFLYQQSGKPRKLREVQQMVRQLGG